MTAVSLQAYLLLGLTLFCIGLYGALTKRNLIIVLVSIELMLNAVNINLVAFGKFGVEPSVTGQVFALFSMVVAAAEVAVGMAIILAFYRNRKSIYIDEANQLGEQL